MIARKGIQIISTEDTVYITSPKEIRLIGGGSELKINGSGVFPTTGGKFEVKAGQHKFVGGSTVQPKNIFLPLLGETQNWMELNYHYDDLSPVKGAPFKVFFEDGSYREGVLDDKGYAKLENVPKGKSEIFYGEDPAEFKRDIPDDLDAETQEEDENDDNLWSLLDEEAYQKLTNDLQNGAK